MTNDCLTSSLLGIVRGAIVHTLIYPLEVIKVHKQCSPENSFSIARRMLYEGGLYRGLSAQLVKTSIKQAWCWPIITGGPAILNRYALNDLSKQALTGVGIAAIDALITTPLERAKILSILASQKRFSWKEGWRGCPTHFFKLSVNWSTFLVTQKYFRNQYSEKLTFPQLVDVGTRVACIVSLTSAPLDVVHTLKQAQNKQLSHFFTKSLVHTLYRGWHLSALSRIIHNIASIALIDHIS